MSLADCDRLALAEHQSQADAWVGSQEPCEFQAHYDLQERVLGTGALGVVREAVCRRSSRRVAVKSMNKTCLSEKQLEEVRAELDLHATLSHPSIVKFEAAFESDAEVFVVQELLSGGELFDRVTQRTRLSEKEAANIAMQLLEAVAFMHGRNVMHRDIKLENIVFSQEEGSRVKLIDFGYATRFEDGAMVNGMYGSLRYVAPEVLQGQAYDARADVWSLGAVVYAMVLGRVPFCGDDRKARRQNMRGEVDYTGHFRSLSREAQEFIRWLLSVDPAQRPTAEEALRHPWLQRAREEASTITKCGGMGKKFAEEVTCESIACLTMKLWRQLYRAAAGTPKRARE